MIAAKKGDRVSEYILEEPLGKGGFGEVWLASHHLWSDRKVAVKIPTSLEAIGELRNEGRLQGSLEHPGIAKTLGMDPAADPPYFITEFVPGRNLRQVLEQSGPLGHQNALSILEQILAVLEYAHSQGVVHQDIKPENIILTPDGDIKVTDFGLGTNVKGESIMLSASLRSTERAGGTLPYIAPEVRDGHGEVDGRVDLYSLGIVFFELLTGKRPVGAEVPSDLVATIPENCDKIFSGLYARRSKRFTSVADVRQALTNAQQGTTKNGASPPPLKKPASGARSKTHRTNTVQLTLEQAAARVGVSVQLIRDWIQQGLLTPFSVSGKIYVGENELESVRSESSVVAAPVYRQGASIDADRLVPAGVAYRAIALLIDSMLLSLVTTMKVFPFVLLSWKTFPFVTGLLYFSLMHGLLGQTMGKMLMGIKVVRMDGTKLTLGDGIVRTLNYVLSALPLGLGFMMAIFSRRRLAFHDLICGTRVIHQNARKG